ncbi:hypothetical protein D3C84_744230 [compost metagenome]
MLALAVDQTNVHHSIGFQGAEHGKAFQVIRVIDVMPPEERGAGHHQHLCLTESAGYQQRVFVARLTYAQSNIDAFGHQIDATVDQHDLQLYLRIFLEKTADHPRQHFVGQSDRRGHPQATAWFAGHARHGFIGHFGFQQHRLAMSQVAFTHGRQLELAGGALQQTRAETLLQFGNAPRQPRLGNPQ